MFKMFSILTFSGMLAISSAYAQSKQLIQATIPFAFTVQNTTLAAGNYQLSYSSNGHILTVRGLDENLGGAFAIATW
jgi:hypothetical protein